MGPTNIGTTYPTSLFASDFLSCLPDKLAILSLLITSEGRKIPHSYSPHDLAWSGHFAWWTALEFSTTEPCMKAFNHRPEKTAQFWRRKHGGKEKRQREGNRVRTKYRQKGEEILSQHGEGGRTVTELSGFSLASCLTGPSCLSACRLWAGQGQTEGEQGGRQRTNGDREAFIYSELFMIEYQTSKPHMETLTIFYIQYKMSNIDAIYEAALHIQ